MVEIKEDYVIIYTNKNEPIYIDIEDIKEVIKYKWVNDGNGYAQATIKNKRIRMHRYIMQLHYKNIGRKNIDHINHNTLDNRKSNLRICNTNQNNENRKLQRNNTSKITGVYWHSQNNNWIAKININGKSKHLGSFNNKEDAIKCRLEAENKYYKDFSYNNSIIERNIVNEV